MDISEDLKETFIKSRTEIVSICRVCLAVSQDYNLLFDSIPTLAEKLSTCTGVEMVKDDGYPANICLNCCSDLETAYSFRMRCKNSDSLLKKHYFKNNVKIECDESTNISCDIIGNNLHKLSRDNENSFIDENMIKVELNIDYLKSAENNVNITKITLNDDDDFLSDNGDLDGNETSNKKYKCDLCTKPLCSKYSLKYHLKAMHNDKTKRAGYVTGFGSQRRYQCDSCPYSTPHSQSLKYHRRIHTGEKPFRCDVCDKCFSQPGSLSCHKKTHSDKTYFTCAECGKQFKYKDSYETHKNVHVETKNFVCNICNKGLKTKVTLQAHLNRHNNIKNFSCETCGALFVTNVELLNHSKKHAAVKKFKCDFCDFKTYMKKGLMMHLRRHTGERPFKCDMCELACYTKGELKCHQRKHTKEKNYSCPMCNMKFSHSSSVNKHMFNTHGVRYNRLNVDRRVVK